MRYSIKVELCIVCFLLLSSQGFSQSALIRRVCSFRGTQNHLFWYPFKDTCDDFKKVVIHAKEDKFSTYKVIDSVLNWNMTEYLHKNAIAFQNGFYYLEYVVKCGGVTKSYFSDTTQVDLFTPGAVTPDSVSVDLDGNIEIGWTKEGSKDNKGYIIYLVKGADNYPVDTVLGQLSTFFLDKKDNGGGGPLQFKLAVLDSCDNVGPLGNYHQTVYVGSKQDSCKKIVELSWTPYIGWSAGVNKYDIFVSKDPLSGYSLIGSTTGLSYAVSGLSNYTNYYFFIRAHQNGKTAFSSSSNKISVTTNFQQNLLYLYISTVSVTDQGVLVKWVVSQPSEIGYFEISRSKNPGVYYKIRTIVSNGAKEYSFLDTETDPSSDLWYYQIRAVNTCGSVAGNSNISHNIILTLVKNDKGRYLSWNDYGTWRGGVAGYHVNRLSGDEAGNEVKDNIGDATNSLLRYIDTETVFGYRKTGVCYYVQAFEGDTNRLGLSELSNSNKVCFIDPPIVYVPNVFNPYEGGVNIVFRPSLINVDTAISLMQVYNRWGERIKTITNIAKGWDGYLSNGKLAESGVYMYYLIIKGLDGSIQSYKGTFTLL